MRRKKNLYEHLSECGDYYIEIKEDNRDTRVFEYAPLDIDALFGRQAPLYLEIGCGKGAFAIEFAKRNPDYNILAVEKSKNVLLNACRGAMQQNVPNVRFLCVGAEYADRHLARGSVEGIYLNFSCPYPKESYANHRLTSPRFLEIYKKILADGAHIYQKTDHPRFFEYSIENLTKAGFMLCNISLDLHSSVYAEDNIMTEYESRFVSQGKPIYKLEAYYPSEDN